MQPGRDVSIGDEPQRGAYVTFVSGSGSDSSPYSVEGTLAHLGAFAAGATRARGWRRVAAKVLVLAILLPIVVATARGVWTLLTLLLG